MKKQSYVVVTSVLLNRRKNTAIPAEF